MKDDSAKKNEKTKPGKNDEGNNSAPSGVPGGANSEGSGSAPSSAPGGGKNLTPEAPDGYKSVEVQTGISSDDYTEIISGLNEGQEIYRYSTGSSSSSLNMSMPGGGMGGGNMGGGGMGGGDMGGPGGGGGMGGGPR